MYMHGARTTASVPETLKGCSAGMSLDWRTGKRAPIQLTDVANILSSDSYVLKTDSGPTRYLSIR